MVLYNYSLKHARESDRRILRIEVTSRLSVNHFLADLVKGHVFF